AGLKAGRVDERHLAALGMQDAEQQVARRLRARRDDRKLLAQEPVEQARFAGIGAADEADAAAAERGHAPSRLSSASAACCSAARREAPLPRACTASPSLA